MGVSQPDSSISRVSNLAGRLVLVVAVVAGCALLGEALVRLAGFRAWTPPWVQFEVDPGGRLYEADPALGYVNLPGQFTVTMEWPHRFVATVDPDHRRVNGVGAPRQAPEIWVLGGSFTYGWLVEDSQAYPALLQRQLTRYRVVNFGTPGYGTVQSLLQIEEALGTGAAPDVVILAYASFHDIRNTVVRRLRKTRVLPQTAGDIRLPRARLDGSGELVLDRASLEYRPYPLMRLSALVHLLEQTVNRLEIRRTREADVSRAIIEWLRDRCVGAGCTLMIVGLTSHPDTVAMLEYWEDRGVPVADISVDGTDPDYNFRPYDNHPSPLAHESYARGVGGLLKLEGYD